MRLLPTALLLALLPAAPAEAQEARALEIEMSPHRIVESGGDAYGALRLLGAWRLYSEADSFGGFSGLEISEDGRELLAVSDSGHWLSAKLTHRADGLLTSLSDARLGSLLDLQGHPLPERGKAWSDAEALTRLADGSLLVAFERRHRLWRYPDLAGLPESFPAPAGHAAGSNKGLEGLALLPDGRLVAFSEGLRAEDGNWRAWIYQEGKWHSFRYRRRGGLAPVGAGALPDGGLLILERSYTVLGGLWVRLMRVGAQELVPGALVAAEELASWREPPFDIDNFEAVAARPAPGGRTLIYLLADDNFNAPLQETLLLLLVLRSGEGGR